MEPVEPVQMNIYHEHLTSYIPVCIIVPWIKWGDNDGNLPIVYIDILIFYQEKEIKIFMHAMGKLSSLSPHFIHGTIIQTGIWLALYSHVFNTTVFALFKFKTLIFILKGPQCK